VAWAVGEGQQDVQDFRLEFCEGLLLISKFLILEYGMPQSLLPQDVVVLAKLISGRGLRPPLAQLATDLSLSVSQVHLSMKRLEQSRLIESGRGGPVLRSVEEFLLHGVKYVFPARRGEMTRGVPTAYAAPPLSRHIVAGADLPPVWPDADGSVRGVTLEPLHKIAPRAAKKDPVLYELLALIDALRDGRVRERRLAERELSARLRSLLRG
jgi:hypothetical protein